MYVSVVVQERSRIESRSNNQSHGHRAGNRDGGIRGVVIGEEEIEKGG
jgi:hypothetical protein